MGNACCGSPGAIVVGYRQLESERVYHNSIKHGPSEGNRLNEDDKENAPLINAYTSQPTDSDPPRPWTSPPKRRVFDYQQDNERVTTIYSSIRQRERPSVSKTQSCAIISVNPRHRPKTPSFNRENTGYSLNYELPTGYMIETPSKLNYDESNHDDKETKSEYKSSGYASTVSFHLSPSRANNSDTENGDEENRPGLRRQNSLNYKLPGGYQMPTSAEIEPPKDYQILKVHSDNIPLDSATDSYSYNVTSSAKLGMRGTYDLDNGESYRTSVHIDTKDNRKAKSTSSSKSSNSDDDDVKPEDEDVQRREHDNKPPEVEKLTRYFESMNEASSDKSKLAPNTKGESDKRMELDCSSSTTSENNNSKSQKASADSTTSEGSRKSVNRFESARQKSPQSDKKYDDSTSSSSESNNSTPSRKRRRKVKRRSRPNSSTSNNTKDSAKLVVSNRSPADVETGNSEDEKEENLLAEIQKLKQQLVSLLSQKHSVELVLHPIVTILQQFVELRRNSHDQNQECQSNDEEFSSHEEWQNVQQKQKEESEEADEKYARELAGKKDTLCEEYVTDILHAHMENREKLRRKHQMERENLRKQLKTKPLLRKSGKEADEMTDIVKTSDDVTSAKLEIIPETTHNENDTVTNENGDNTEHVEAIARNTFYNNELEDLVTSSTEDNTVHERNIQVEARDQGVDDSSREEGSEQALDQQPDKNENGDVGVAQDNDECEYEDDFHEEDAVAPAIENQHHEDPKRDSVGSTEDVQQSESEVDLPVFEEDDVNEKELLDILQLSMLKKKEKMSRDDFKDLMAIYREQQKSLNNKQSMEEFKSNETLKQKLEARRKKRIEAEAQEDIVKYQEEEAVPGSIAVETETRTIYVTDTEIQTFMDDVLDDDSKTRSVQIMDKGFLRKFKTKQDLSENEVKDLLESHLAAVAKLENKKEEQRLKQLGVIDSKLKERKSKGDASTNEKAEETENDENSSKNDTQLESVQQEILGHRDDMTEEELKELLEKHHQRRRALLRKRQFDKYKNEEEIKKRLEERKKRNKMQKEGQAENSDQYTDKSLKDIALENELAELDERFYKDLKKKKKNKELTDEILSELMKEHNDNSDWIRKQRANENKESARKLRQRLKERKQRNEQTKLEKDESVQNEETGQDVRERHQQIKQEEETMRRFSLQRADSVIVRTKKKEDELRMMVNDDKQRRKEELKARLEARKREKMAKIEGN